MSESKQHAYAVQVAWTGNLGKGTRTYRSYTRDHQLSVAGKPPIDGSSDPAFLGDPSRYNPEELLVGSLAACHMLWYLHLCAQAKIVVTAYRDDATGTMTETVDGGGRFEEVVLRPRVTIEAAADRGLAETLHDRAHELCFIANSVSFPVRCAPVLGAES